MTPDTMWLVVALTSMALAVGYVAGLIDGARRERKWRRK